MLSLGKCQGLPLLWHRVLVKGWSEEQEGMLCLEQVFIGLTLRETGFFWYLAQHTDTFERGTDSCVLGKLPTPHKQGHRGEVRPCCSK